MSTQQYANVEVYADGGKFLESTSVKLTRDAKGQIIETLGRGFAGISPGAKMLSIGISNAVPAASMEYDAGTKMGRYEPVELTLFAAGKTLPSKGFWMSDDFSGAVNSPSGLELSFVGEWAEWE